MCHFTKRLHDRNKRGAWLLLLLLLAVMLGLTDTSSLEPFWQWAIGRFLPSFYYDDHVVRLWVFIGTQGENYFGAARLKRLTTQVFVKVCVTAKQSGAE